MINNKWLRGFIIYSLLAGLVVILGVLLYAYHAASLLQTANITSSCNSTNGNIVRSSPLAYSYAMNASHWNNISVFLNQTCLKYQNATNPYKQVLTDPIIGRAG